MKKRIATLIIILLNFMSIFGQETSDTLVNDSLFKPNYPTGIYKTKEDFIKRIPWKNYKIVPKGIYGFNKTILTTIEHNCFFYYTGPNIDYKVENVFAISYKGHLYFQINAILKNRNKTDRAQTSSFPNSFVRVILGGDNYLYTEAELANAWAQGAAYGAGGAVGSALAGNMVYGKGVVWDYKNNEFNIFKNCQDYNDFIADKYKDGIQTCKKNQPDALKVRMYLEKIK